MGKMSIIDNTGDTKVIWDKDNADEVEAAEDQFDTLINKGFVAYAVTKSGEAGKKIKKFLAKAGKIIMIPPIAGG